MIKQYFTQAWAQLRQQPMISAVSIAGTALAIFLHAGGDDAAGEGSSVCSGEQPRPLSTCALYEHHQQKLGRGKQFQRTDGDKDCA